MVHIRRWWVGLRAHWVLTALAFGFVALILVAPTQQGRLAPAGFLRVPVEGLLVVALLLVLPPRARRVVALVVGGLLGLLAIAKVADLGFYAAFDRPSDLTADWAFLGPAVGFVARSYGQAGAVGAVAVVALLVAAVLALAMLAMLRLSRATVAHRTAATRGVAGLTVGWVVLALAGAQLVPRVPMAAHTGYDRLRQIGAGISDAHAFANESTVDGYRETPAGNLLTGLRGKDVVLTFVESYGRVAVEDPALAPRISARLDDGYRRLRADGYTARSGFLASPTAGGGSWLAHSTLQSGLWIDNQRRYTELVGGQRLTLTGAFDKAGWRTVGVVPGNDRDWPDAAFYGFDQIYDARGVGYAGPAFSFSSIPDQYTLAAFQRLEHGRSGRPPLFAEIDLLSSHAPWRPVPQVVDWNILGDGRVFGTTTGAGDAPESVLEADRTVVKADYGHSVEYSLACLLSYVETYGDDNLVLIFLGDHQPAPVVAGDGATRDVPITIVARDPSVLDRIAGWGWSDGLRPAPNAPVWRMDTFRDRFLAAYGPAH